MNEKIFLRLEGRTDDLLFENGFLKMTRLVQDRGDETLDVTVESRTFAGEEQITSVLGSSNDITGEHPKFDELLGKKIRITVEVIE